MDDDMVSVQAHVDYVLVRLFSEAVDKFQGNSDVRRILTMLCMLYAIHGIIQDSAELLMANYLTSSDVDKLRETLYSLYGQLRPDAVHIVDSLELSDRMLNSAIGRYDGRVYETLYQWASQSSLNDTQVHQSYIDYIKPLQDMMKSRL